MKWRAYELNTCGGGRERERVALAAGKRQSRRWQQAALAASGDHSGGDHSGGDYSGGAGGGAGDGAGLEWGQKMQWGEGGREKCSWHLPLHVVRQCGLADASTKNVLPMSFASFEPSEFTFKYAKNPVKKLPCKP